MSCRVLMLAMVWLATVATATAPAHACGGCFAPPQQTTVSAVTGHRMVFAISETRTVLWDQFSYSGSPQEFAWVLPVARGAYLEEADQAWFDALDAATSTTITAPPLLCANSGSSGPGCGAAYATAEKAGGDRGGSSVDAGGVRVVDHRTVGPYEVVTLRTTSGGELFDWFDQNGYFVPEEIAPIIDDYVGEGWDFLAVKLRPGQGVQQMTPVRVITNGGEGVLPLRMVAAGVGDEVDILLYVIGEGRYRLPDLEEVRLETGDLTWNFSERESNYSTLRRAALSRNAGFSFLTTFADEAVFDRPIRSMLTTSGYPASTIADLYFAQASENDELSPRCQGTLPDLADDRAVQEDWEGTSLPASGALVCDGYSDLATALVGLVPNKTWLTRLELNLPKYALSMDCIVEPHDDQSPVSSDLDAVLTEGRPSFCKQRVFTSRVVESPSEPSSLVLWVFLGAAALAVWRQGCGVRP